MSLLPYSARNYREGADKTKKSIKIIFCFPVLLELILKLTKIKIIIKHKIKEEHWMNFVVISRGVQQRVILTVHNKYVHS